MDARNYRFLNYLDAPVRCLALTIDELIVASLTLFLLVMTSQKIMVCILGASLIKGLRSLKKGGSPKVLLVLAYWYLPRYATQFFLPELPASYQRVIVA